MDGGVKAKYFPYDPHCNSVLKIFNGRGDYGDRHSDVIGWRKCLAGDVAQMFRVF